MQNKNLPLVSIALCTYNGERFLNKQVDCLLRQDYGDLEIIVIDDCSTDGTVDILKDYAAKDERIKLYFNEQNLGYIKNFEKAITKCSGKYIALADQDDLWELHKISTMIEAIDGHVLVYHDSDFIDENDDRIGVGSMATKTRMYDGESGLPFILFNCISGHATLFDRKLISYILPFKKGFYHDWWMAYIAVNVGKVKYLDQILVHYRQHQNNITDLLELRESKSEKLKPIGNIKRLALNLDYLRYCSQFKHNREPRVINELHDMFSNLSQNKNKIKSFFLLFKYFDLLFYISSKPKNIFSKVNRLRKFYF